jgi:2-polyprenyl-3-methyl-5-hydroxy-6-metoxy-1,4-benzoquinol methylase
MTKYYRKIFYKNYFSEKTNKDSVCRNENSLSNWRYATISRIKNWLPGNKNAKILDIGCGFGNLLKGFKDIGYNNLTGIDISEEQIAKAIELNSRINFNCIDLISYLKSENKKFDLITVFDVIEHLEKDEALEALKLIHDALNANGQLIIQTPNAESPWFGAVAFGDFTHEWFYTTSSLEDILFKSGFNNIEFKPSGPLFISFKSSVRRILWIFINSLLKIWNLAETGSIGSKIYTRVFLTKAVKR